MQKTVLLKLSNQKNTQSNQLNLILESVNNIKYQLYVIKLNKKIEILQIFLFQFIKLHTSFPI